MITNLPASVWMKQDLSEYQIFDVLFETMEIHYVKRNPDDGYDESTLFNRITLKINPDFAYLVNQL
ncbi:hypothetical protein VWM73_12065, partial [Campylobacter coli]